MLKPPIPPNERERLEALRRYDLLDTPPEEDLDLITSLLANTLNVPIALISLVDENRQWFKARVGLEATETSRDVSFCAHAVAANEPLVISDTLDDERFADNPFVLEDPRIRFYAGFPLRTTDGYVMGTLCAIDQVPRNLTAEQLAILESLAGIVETNLRLRYRLKSPDKSKQFRTFVEMAVHDLKNPLFVVSAIISMIKNDPQVLDGDDGLLALLEGGAQTLNSRLFSILDMVTDMDGDGMRLELNQLSPAHLVQQVLRTTSVSAASSRISVQSDVAEDCGNMAGDAGVLERLLENLILNGIKFTPSGGNIEVGVRRADGQCIEFRIADCGPGVPEADRLAIFEPFNRGNAKPGRGNVGLGLAFCKMAAESHGGSIWVENSSNGQGACFCVRIPVASA